MTQLVGVVDTGRTNLLSVVKAIEYIGEDVFVCRSAEEVAQVDRVILPGVGAFRDGIAALRERHFDEALDEARRAGMPVLGICLGMQMLAHTSDEDGQHAGLGWLPADVVRISSDDVRVPHVGWNDTEVVRPSPIFSGLSVSADFYYTHSYHVQARSDDLVDAVVHHGTPLTAAVRQDNVAAVQFHPEKSQDHGLSVLTNFFDWDPSPDVLKRRLIPKLLVRPNDAGRPVLVTTHAFDQRFEIGDPVSQARIFQAQIADELVFLDFEGWRRERSLLGDILRKAAQEIFMPITAGGGVRSVTDVRNLLINGADKVSINSAAVEDPALVSEAARAFGSQCVVVSIDYLGEGADATVRTKGGTHDTGLDVVAWAREAERLGAGELLLTSMARDGGGAGMDVETIRLVVEAVRIPVVAGGGCGTAAHFIAGMQAGGAAGVAAGTFFSFRDQNLMQTRSHIANSGLHIRMHL